MPVKTNRKVALSEQVDFLLLLVSLRDYFVSSKSSPTKTTARASSYPDAATVTALRSRLQAQQNLKLSQLNLQLQQLISQKSVLRAQAEVRAAQIRAASLTPRLVKFRHVKDIEIVGVPRAAIINIPPDAASDTTPDTGKAEAGQ